MKNHKKIFYIVILLFLGSDICVSQPNTEWVQRFNSPGNLNEDLIDMALDKDGNAYMTGNAGGDIVTLKYSHSGNFQWVKIYNGPANRIDEAVKIAVDDSGFVYVAGKTFNPLEFTNYLILKYSNNGDLIFSKEFNIADSTTDVPRDMVIDDSSNIFITGYGRACLNCTSDYMTLKYNKFGNLIWSKIYHGEGWFSNYAWTLAIDKLNRIIVSGMSTHLDNSEYNATLIYDSNGDLIRIIKIDSAEVRRLETDEFYNFYIGGNIISDFSPNNIDIFLNKYDSSGTLDWNRKYGSNNSTINRNDYFTWMHLDRSNMNVYITGLSDFNNQNGWDFSLAKYNSNGDSLWKRGYSPISNSDNESVQLAIDKFSNVYITGIANYNTPFYRIMTVKYDSLGNFKWVQSYVNYLFANHYGKRVLIDSTNSVYVGGTSYDPATSSNDIVLIKYSQVTIVNQLSVQSPKNYILYQNYPNPFNLTTRIKYSLPVSSNVKIYLYNVLGSKIEELENSLKNEGTYEINFNAEKLSSGIYFYSMSINGMEMDKKKIILIK